MKITVRQIYGQAGVNFPFSHLMQQYLRLELSALEALSPEFIGTYGEEFTLVFNISARAESSEVDVLGPTVYRKTKDVEYSVFLPFDVIVAAEDGCRAAVEFLMHGIEVVFGRACIDAAALEASRASIVERICSDPTMLEQPWLDALPRRYNAQG